MEVATLRHRGQAVWPQANLGRGQPKQPEQASDEKVPSSETGYGGM